MEQKIKQDSKVPIGRNIRTIRKAQGMMQQEVVTQMQLDGQQMTRQALYKIENGVQHITGSQLVEFRKVFGVSYDEIFKEREYDIGSSESE